MNRPPQHTGEDLDGLLTLSTREAIDILNGDDAAMTDDLADAVGAAVERSLDQQGVRGRRWRRRRKQSGHWLCGFLEEIVEALATLTPATVAGNAVKAGCRQAGLGRTTTTVAVAAAEKLTQIVVASLHFATPLAHTLFMFRIAAMGTCPNPDEHPSLDQTCANPLAGELTADSVKVHLRGA